jgi:hypothetical protein
MPDLQNSQQAAEFAPAMPIALATITAMRARSGGYHHIRAFFQLEETPHFILQYN